ncbi:MAG TPA: hypothetical protein VJ901_10060 [Thermoanaerobaculia bacterium]|nr:hypothetical protein [Thermoanaerobaculia bacterium]
MRRTIPLALAVLFAGCSLFSPKKAVTQQLENVAKDWCLTMRASQVLCVYPLSEDVQTGDIYLVNTSIPNQIKQYTQNGFLPFDMLLTRLQPVNYRAMYANAYATQDQWGNIPHQWQFPPNATTNNWAAAPHAAFPSYTFGVQQGQSLKLAVPVQAVPIGLSLLNTNEAHGAIEISDASTYGVDQLSLDQQVESWAACPTTRALLARYAPDGPNTHYIRVITRVYLTGKVNVSVTNDASRGGGVDAGVAQNAQLPASATPGDVATSYSNMLTTLNNSLTSSTADVSKPGGSIRIAAVSSRSVSLSQTFSRPIVIGYIAYDRAIGSGGVLGQPRPTLQQMEGTVDPAPQPTQSDVSQSVKFGADANSSIIRAWVKDDVNRTSLQQWLDAQKITTSIPLILNGDEFASLRQRIIDELNLGGPCGTAGH